MPYKNSKILLLQSPITLKKEDVATFGLSVPLGLAYLAAVLLQDGYEVKIYDLLAEGFNQREETGNGMVRLGLKQKQIKSILLRDKPRIVGISNNFTSFSADAVRLAKLVHQYLPKTFIVMGGAQATAKPESILKSEYVDSVVLGEGEFTFRDLVDFIYKRDYKKARQLKGTVWFLKGKIINNGYQEPVANLDSLPFPAYHLLPMQRYIWQKKANFAVVMRYPVGHMITTRGCRYNCIFCSTVKHFKLFRTRSSENVLAEMKMLIKDYGIREFHFHDDSIMSDPNHVRKICELIIKEGLNIRWQVSQGINSILLDDKLLELMHKSGMYRVGFPIESGSEKMLHFIRKAIRLKKVKKPIEKCNQLGIYTFGCFMIGFPEETRNQIRQTRDFILSSGLDYVKISITQPLAGSELYGIYKKLGLCNEANKEASTYFHTNYDTVNFKAEELNKMREEIMQAFARQRIKNILSPRGFARYILPKLRSFENILYFLKVSWLALRGY